MDRIGRHVSIAGSLDSAFDRAASIGCTSMQIFVTNPRSWRLSEVDKRSEDAFRSKARSTGITAVAHMPYLPNLASSSREIFPKSIKALAENARRCDVLGIDYLVTHMGSHMGYGKERGLARVAEAVSEALSRSKSTMILLENEAGHKNSVGDNIEDLSAVYDAVGDVRLGFCLDTCHLFASGYDITSSKVLDGMFSALDMKKVFVIHVNDALKDLGSHLDRHANIGFGHIGIGGFRSFLKYKGISSKILILETPGGLGITEATEIALVRGLIL